MATTTTFQLYNSTAEAAQDIREAKTRKAWRGQCQDMETPRWQAWAGETLSSALLKLSEGDADAAATIKAQGDIIVPATRGRANRLENAVVGCIPNVPAYLRGLPKQMQRVRVEHREKPVISIFVESGIADGTDTEKAAQAAAAIANVVAATEAAGVRVNLYAAVCSTRDGKCYGMAVRLKAAESPLNLLNVAFALTSRAVCRGIFMRWMETHVDGYVNGYGRPMLAEEVGKMGLINGLVLSVNEIIIRGLTLTDLTAKVNHYIAHTV